MKKLITFSAFLCLFANINAQIHKGSWLISGNASTSISNVISLNDDIEMLDSKATSARLNFGVGYFAHKRWLIGLKGAYENFKTLSINNNNNTLEVYNSKWITYTLQPYTRYYFTPNKKIKLYTEAKADMSVTDLEMNTYDNISPINVRNNSLQYDYNLRAALGFNYFLSNNVAIDFQLPYMFYRRGRKEGKDIYLDNWNPYRFNTALSMNLFLNADKKESKVLADKYLQKGNITVGIDGSSFLSRDYNTFNIKPSIGYFLTKHWLIGTETRLIIIKKWVGLSALPFVKYYQPIQKDIQLVAAAKTGGMITYEKEKFNVYGHDLNVGIGINKFIAENISIEALINISGGIREDKKIEKTPFATISLNYFMDKKWHKKGKK